MCGRSASMMPWLLVCLIFGGFPISVSAQQGPNDAVAKPGDAVSFTFSDETTTTSDYFFWVRYNPKPSTIYAQTDTQPADPAKYSVLNNGTFVLTVNSVAFADAATYCFFSSKTKQQSCGNLVVIESVNATVYPSNGLLVGQTANLTCEVEYAGPTTDEDNLKPLSDDQRPQLSMYIGNTQPTNLPPGEDIIGSDKMTHSRSVSINHTITAADVGQYLICKATTKSPQFNLSSSRSLEVISNTTYANIAVLINATTNPGGRCCLVNDILNCTANGYPFPQFKWTTDDGLTLTSSKSGNGYSELLINVGGTHTVACSARNNVTGQWHEDTVTFNSVTGVVNGSASTGQNKIGLGVGIGVGVGVPVLIGVILLIVFLSRRKKAKPITVKQPEKKTPVGQTGNAPVKNGKGPEPGSRNNVNPNPNPTYYTPVMPEQTGTAAPKNVRDSPGYGDLGVRHLGGSGSNPHLNESFDSQADKSFESSRSNRQSGNLQFTDGKTHPSPSAPNTSV